MHTELERPVLFTFRPLFMLSKVLKVIINNIFIKHLHYDKEDIEVGLVSKDHIYSLSDSAASLPLLLPFKIQSFARPEIVVDHYLVHNVLSMQSGIACLIFRIRSFHKVTPHIQHDTNVTK